MVTGGNVVRGDQKLCMELPDMSNGILTKKAKRVTLVTSYMFFNVCMVIF